jgi:nitrate/TMAO reductase-like tetraheme cytochrome c subunit/mono/diheme cytochrome c family protein
MKRFFGALRRFFAPPADSPFIIRIAPYLTVVVVMVALFIGSTYAWEYTNEAQFCGLTCHTMPPQFAAFQRSAHASESCEDCHLGRDTMSVMIPRKIYYSWHTGTSMVFGNYNYPIIAKEMNPARVACENCHNPTKFSSDKLFTIKRFSDDKANTLTTLYMVLKTGGGSKREGLGQGIHWHVENPVYYYATDVLQQDIPYVLVTKADGTTSEYIDTESKFDPKSIKKEDLREMDCITCHNRTAHAIESPSGSMDTLMGRGVVSPTIPEIHKIGAAAIGKTYATQAEGLAEIGKLEAYYQQNYADFYAKNTAMVKAAVTAIKSAFEASVYIDQKMNWLAHPDNMQHKDFPGCMRCHDGKHVTPNAKDTVRLECNLCHSIPTASTTFQLVAEIPVEKGFEPDSHKNANWINFHRTAFDKTCQTCHTTADAGGVSNKSFCSNSVCHGATWKFAGFDAPKLKEVLKSQQPTPAPTAVPTAVPTLAPTTSAAAAPTATPASGSTAAVTFAQVGPIFVQKCGACHGDAGIKGLFLTTYEKVMAGSADGPVIVPGKPDDSKLMKVQTGGTHPGQFSSEELDLVKKWITGGALEK